jgi:hypothetical protein
MSVVQQQQFSNLAQTTLGANYIVGSSTLTLASGAGTLFPTTGTFTIGIGDPPSFYLVCTSRSGDVLTVNTSGAEGTTAVNAGVGTIVAQVLSAGVLNSFAGRFPLLEIETVSGAPYLSLTGWYSSNYDVYEIVFANVYCSGGGIPVMHFSTNYGVSYDTGNNYMWTQFLFGADTAQYYNANDVLINLCNFTDVAPGLDAGISGTYRLTLPSGGYTNINGSCFTGRTADGGPPNPAIQSCIAGKYKTTTNINAFQFYFTSTGAPTVSYTNIVNGSIRVYGIGKI